MVEGRERIGGRIYSVGMGEAIVDLGASWIHGVGKGVDEDKRGRWKN